MQTLDETTPFGINTVSKQVIFLIQILDSPKSNSIGIATKQIPNQRASIKHIQIIVPLGMPRNAC